MASKPIPTHAIISILLAFLITPQPASADGNKLLKACTAGLRVIEKDKNTSNMEVLDSAYCAGLIQGITDFNRINRMSGGSPFFCMPGDVISKEQATRAVVKYLEAHPEKLKSHESNLVIEALTEAFPCR